MPSLQSLPLTEHGRNLLASRRSFAALACEAVDWLSLAASASSSSADEMDDPPPPHPSPCLPPEPEDDDDTEPLHFRFSKVLMRVSKSGGFSVREIEPAPPSALPHSYNKLMKVLCEVGDIDEVLRLFDEMKRSPKCNPNVLCYNTVMNALVMADRFEEAEAIFEEMKSSGVKPNVSSYNILVKLYSCYWNNFDLAKEVIFTMKENGIIPNSTTFSTLITGLCWAGRVGDALLVLDAMLDEKCPHTVHAYTPIVQSYCSEGRIKDAKSLMVIMEEAGCPPNSVTYNIYIDALCKAGGFDEIEHVLAESEAKGWKLNEITYNTFMDGLCKYGKAKEAFELLEVMLNEGMYPTAVTLNILLDCLCHDSKVLEAKCLIERSYELGWNAGTVGYNTVMSRLCETGRWLAAIKLFNDMLKKGINPTTRTFNIIVHSLCIGGKYRIANSMINGSKFGANVVTYNTLIHWFYQEGKINDVKHVFSCMDSDNITWDRITCNIVVDGLCRGGKYLEAVDFFIQSLENHFSMDLVLRLIRRLIKNRRMNEILLLFKGIKSHKACIDVSLVESSIKMLCHEGFCHNHMPIVCQVLDSMLEKQPF